MDTGLAWTIVGSAAACWPAWRKRETHSAVAGNSAAGGAPALAVPGGAVAGA